MRALIAIACLGAVLIALGVLAHHAAGRVSASRRRADALDPHNHPHGDVPRIPVRAIGDRDV
ncbi:hypothetical protein FBQ73_07260 [Xanthobacter autotrophicus]|uniref:Uncharacterized protein n=2 Tax=Xanthobacter autotrophicus TaxID=280 RepID=A0A6C1KI71_XANAU|nr:hypothetical protein FBQ73_07260 [Xanthobacter autotrophicus]